MGNLFTITCRMNLEYRWRATNIINFILKFYRYLPKGNKERKLCQGARETSLDLLCTCRFVMEIRFDAMLCSNM